MLCSCQWATTTSERLGEKLDVGFIENLKSYLNSQQTATYQKYLKHYFYPPGLLMRVFTNVQFFSFKQTTQTLHSLNMKPKNIWGIPNNSPTETWSTPTAIQGKCGLNLNRRWVLMVFYLAELKTKALKSLRISSGPFYLKLGRMIHYFAIPYGHPSVTQKATWVHVSGSLDWPTSLDAK